jgi:hypothetical protein
MADVLVSRAQLDSVKAALFDIKSNGQALAAIDSSLSAAAKLAKALRSDGGAYRQGAAKDIDDAAGKVQAIRKDFAGMATSPVGKSWTDATTKVTYLWVTIFLVEKGLPPGEDVGDGFKDALGSAVRDLPTTIGRAAGVVLATAAKAVTTVAKTAATVGGSVVWAFVKEAWPILLVAGLGVGAYLYVARRALP